MSAGALDIAVVGLSITSAWGNGHATTFRGLIRSLAQAGHSVTFYERDVPWYRDQRDLPSPDFCRLVLYDSVEELIDGHGDHLQFADAVIVGSYVPEGIAVLDRLSGLAEGILAFYDIDTPITLEGLERGTCEYLAPRQIRLLDLYLSFTGGPVLRELETRYGVPAARPLYCSFDADLYRPVDVPLEWDLGYLGTYSEDRQPGLERLLLRVARELPEHRFTVGGPMYPGDVQWPENVSRTDHVPPDQHASYYSAQRFTLNLTRAAMIRLGYSPSVRLFEAAACAVPIISDRWSGIEEIFEPGREILLCDSSAEVAGVLTGMPEEARNAVGARARARVLSAHTAGHRAAELDRYLRESIALRERQRARLVHSMVDEAQPQS